VAGKEDRWPLTAVSGNSKFKIPNSKQIQNLKSQIQNEFFFSFFLT